MTKYSRTDRVVEVLRDGDGRLYSLVRPEPNPRLFPALVVDRQDNRGGRRSSAENFVRNRAQHLAKILELPYVEDLRWPCQALELRGECMCPNCSVARAADIGVRDTRPVQP